LKKNAKSRKIGEKGVKSCNLIDLVDDGLQSVMTYVYIGSRMQLLDSYMTKSFLNQ
jgi:hypothetical protein